MGNYVKGFKTSEFWTHIAVMLAGFGTLISTLFDKGFLDAHPLISGLVGAGTLALMGLSQAAYVIGRSRVKASAASDTAVAV